MFDYLHNPPKAILSVIGLCLDITGFLMLGIEIIANDKFFELYDREEKKIADGLKKDNWALLRLTFHTNRFFSTIIFFIAIALLFYKFSNGYSKVGIFVSAFLIFIPSFILFQLIKSRKHNPLSNKAITKPLYYLAEILYIPSLIISVLILFIPEKIVSPILLRWYIEARTIHKGESESYFKKTSFYGILLVVLGFIFQAMYYFF